MTLPDSYTIKPGAIPEYFKAIINAEAPERFSTKFLESLDFKSTNDRLLIGIMKELGFIDTDGIPKPRYFELLDKTKWKTILGLAIKDSYSALFAVNKDANTLSVDEVRNKLRTLYAGGKKDTVITNIAKTFRALCDEADFPSSQGQVVSVEIPLSEQASPETTATNGTTSKTYQLPTTDKALLSSLQYHINIVLPESRDQAVYDAIFKSLRDHLG